MRNMSSMNQTEVLAHAWLKRQGITDIVFQPRKTPDFLTPKGNFEAKRVYGNVVYFTAGQKGRITETKSTVIAFEDGYPDPVLTLKPNDLEKETMNGFIIKHVPLYDKNTTTFIQTIDDDQYAYLEGLAKSRHMTVQAFIKNLVIPDWT